jgi:hypothetical protein
MGRGSVLALVAVIPSVLLLGTPGAAASPGIRPAAAPIVGECHDVDDALLQEGGYWVDSIAVPCTEPHTFEVTETGAVPQDVNAFEFAQRQCGSLDVWTAVGVNRSTAGIVTDPVRVEPRSFAVRQASPSYVCGAVAVSFNGRQPPTAVRLTSSIERLRPRARAALQHCSSAANDRSAFAPAITVPCSTRPRWQVASWIIWSALYDDYPGRAALRERAADECGPGAVFVVPTAMSWEKGAARTWCYVKYP